MFLADSELVSDQVLGGNRVFAMSYAAMGAVCVRAEGWGVRRSAIPAATHHDKVIVALTSQTVKPRIHHMGKSDSWRNRIVAFLRLDSLLAGTFGVTQLQIQHDKAALSLDWLDWDTPLLKKYDVAIVGAGIVGLATAMELTSQLPRLRVLVLEKEHSVASHQTGHNSGVIHSGIYYRPGSLKARFCVQGAAEMIRFCRAHNVPYEVCGKVIVATNQEQRNALETLRLRAIENGLSGVEVLTKEQLLEIEPHASGVAALRVPETGITVYRTVAMKYAELTTAAGGEIVTGAKVLAIRSLESEFVLETAAGEYQCSFLINCAGLQSDRIACLSGAELPMRIIPFRGEYFELRRERRSLVRTLIYPVPDPRFPFLGVHFTKRVTGEIEAGPNAVMALRREGYGKMDFTAADVGDALGFRGFWKMSARYWKTGCAEMYRSWSKAAFVRALQTLVPEINEDDLVNPSSGVRAQAVDRDGNLVDDFRFVTQRRALHVCNVPSPAATASLPIGRHIVEKAALDFGWARGEVALQPS